MVMVQVIASESVSNLLIAGNTVRHSIVPLVAALNIPASTTVPVAFPAVNKPVYVTVAGPPSGTEICAFDPFGAGATATLDPRGESSEELLNETAVFDAPSAIKPISLAIGSGRFPPTGVSQ